MTDWSTRRVLLSFDVEEFDLPLEYGQDISLPDQIRISSEGLLRVLDLLDRLDIRATCFTTLLFAQSRPDLMERIMRKHEIASHGLHDAVPDRDNLLRSRIEIEALTGAEIYGFRSPRFSPVNQTDLLEAGYTYSSSENPIWLPGRYMNLGKPRLPYRRGDLLNLPVSASPVIRYPLFWLSFKHTPLWFFKIISSWSLKNDGYLNIFFHPWEFADIGAWRVPALVKYPNGEKMLSKLGTYLHWLKKKGHFVTCREFTGTFDSCI
ncbi:MAG: polysaccharide deacetylase [Nitrospirae bacterium]|nr:polysaccharide deacetylase [Nitrospirota bacterium]